LPFATGFFLCTLASLAVVLVVEKGRLFKPHARAVAPGAKPDTQS
jgi:DHA1 family bicyclomycin/chloramphenicol resistance-like MFS transporter